MQAFIPKYKSRGNYYNKFLITGPKILSAKATFNVQTLDSSHGFQTWLCIRTTRDTWSNLPETLHQRFGVGLRALLFCY